MASRVIFRFQQGLRGWTETFFSASSPDIAASPAEYGEWVAARINCLHPLAKLLSVTAVSLSDFRVAAVKRLNLQGGAVLPSINQLPEYTETAGFYRFTSAKHTRGYWMRGLSSYDVQLDAQTGDWLIRPASIALYDLVAAKTIGRYSTYGYETMANNQWKAITLMELGAQGFTQVSVATGGTVPAANANVYFKGLSPFLKGFIKGTFKVLISGTPANTFTIQLAWPAGLASQPTIAPASWRLADKLTSPILSGSLLRVSDHDTGRPTSLPRGRARGNRVRRSIPVASA